MKYLLSLMIYLLIMIFAIRAQDYPSSVCIDQEGFYPKAQKVAIVTCRVKDNQFYVIRRSNLDTVYRGILSSVRHSSNSSLITRIADFSPLCKTGIFQVVVPGISISYPFRIEADVHRKVALASLNAFYYLRASEDLQPEYAGKWSRRGGHPDTAVIIHASAATPGRKMGSMIPTPCGWYDAGDYNKYIVNSGISTATLLSAFEDFAPYFDTLHTHIPPIGKNVPDILNETLYNLRWMLSMQDPDDGGVYDKCTNAAFDALEMPVVATQPRYVVQKGTAATLDLAAVASKAARIFVHYKDEFPGLSDSCLSADRFGLRLCV